VIPAGNTTLRGRGGAPSELAGHGLADVWSTVLRDPRRFQLLSPTEVLAGAESIPSWSAWRMWLTGRYLT
jgi:hypothetical protein